LKVLDTSTINIGP